MLDLTKLAQQMQGMSQHMTREVEASRKRLELAQVLLEQAKPQQLQLIEQRGQFRDRLLFHPAIPVEPLNRCPIITAPPLTHTAFATDGSQIAPSAHEIAYCYLLNVGRVVLHYHQGRHPLLDSVPEIFYRPEDLYISRQWGIRTEEWMGYRRAVSEATVLAEVGDELLTAQPIQPSTVPTVSLPTVPIVPTVGMVDGSLTYWFLEALPTEARDLILTPILAAWERLRLAGIPLVGYVSASRSSESAAFLRLQACPYPTPDCLEHCAGTGLMEESGLARKAPCQAFEPLRDTALWAAQLQPGQRSPLWRSQARILDLYQHHQVYFCYVNVGTEVARVEVPAWVAENLDQLELALGIVLSQVQKGYGYPVVLAEAHNQAVVRGGDRTRFFALLEQQMIKAGLKNVGTSYKEIRKRGSIA
ncbi:MAG: DNA double-strand break repair nuclease NurA [Microcoleaceae cyanobacterium]